MSYRITEPQQRKLDIILNKTFIDFGVFSLIGYTLGMGASLFFGNKRLIRNFAAGIGGSYAIVLNQSSFNQLI
jgi:hypothetical protein